MSGPRPPGPETSRAYSCIQYVLYGKGDKNNAQVSDMQKALHEKNLPYTKCKKAELKQRIIDNRELWEHEHECGGASSSPPVGTTETTEIAPPSSGAGVIIIEAPQAPNTSAPPTEVPLEGQNKSSIHPSTQP